MTNLSWKIAQEEGIFLHYSHKDAMKGSFAAQLIKIKHAITIIEDVGVKYQDAWSHVSDCLSLLGIDNNPSILWRSY